MDHSENNVAPMNATVGLIYMFHLVDSFHFITMTLTFFFWVLKLFVKVTLPSTTISVFQSTSHERSWFPLAYFTPPGRSQSFGVLFLVRSATFFAILFRAVVQEFSPIFVVDDT